MDSERVALLRRSPIFGGLSDEDLAWLAGAMEPCPVKAGTVVVRAGELGDTLYWIEYGALAVTPAGTSAQPVARMSAGECFGEMAIIEIAPRSASVHALEDSMLYGLRVRALHRLHNERPQAFTMLVLNLARELSRRLRRANAELVALRGPTPQS